MWWDGIKHVTAQMLNFTLFFLFLAFYDIRGRGFPYYGHLLFVSGSQSEERQFKGSGAKAEDPVQVK